MLAFSLDGTCLFSSNAPQLTREEPRGPTKVQRWDLKTGKQDGEWVCDSFPWTHSPDGKRLARWSFDVCQDGWLSPDGRTRAACLEDGIQLSDAKTGKRPHILPGVEPLSFSADGRYLATKDHASGGRIVRLWETATGKEWRPVPGHQSAVQALALSPDGRVAATGGADGLVQLWRTSNQQPLARFAGHTHKITRVAFSPDGRLVASGDASNTVFLWEASSGKEHSRFTLPAPKVETGGESGVTSLAFTPDGRRLLAGTAGGELRCWSLGSLQQVCFRKGDQQDPRSAALSPDGRLLVLWEQPKKEIQKPQEATIQILATRTGKERFRIEPGGDEQVIALTFSGDGKWLLLCCRWQSKDGSSTRARLSLWETATGKEMQSLVVGRGLELLALAPDGRTVIGCSPGPLSESWLRVFDLKSGWERGDLAVRTPQVAALAISPDGRTLLTGRTDGNVLVWDGERLTRQHRDVEGSEPDREQLWSDLTGMDPDAPTRPVAASWPDRTLLCLCCEGQLASRASQQCEPMDQRTWITTPSRFESEPCANWNNRVRTSKPSYAKLWRRSHGRGEAFTWRNCSIGLITTWVLRCVCWRSVPRQYWNESGRRKPASSCGTWLRATPRHS